MSSLLMNKNHKSKTKDFAGGPVDVTSNADSFRDVKDQYFRLFIVSSEAVFRVEQALKTFWSSLFIILQCP